MNGSTSRLLIGVLATVLMLVLGWWNISQVARIDGLEARIEAEAKATQTARLDGFQRLSLLEARYTDIARRLENIDQKLDGLARK